MKKITFFIVLLLVGFAGFAQVENFDGPMVTVPTTPGPWTIESGTWQIFDNGVGAQLPANNWTLNPQATYPANSGTQAAYINRFNIGAGNTSEDYLATPLFQVPADPQLRFYTRTTLAGDQGTVYQVKAAPEGSDPTNPASYTVLLGQWTENELTDDFDVWEEKVLDLSLAVGSNYYIAFVRKFTQNSGAISGDRWLVDDFKFVSKCLDVTDLEVSTLSTSALLSWTNPGTASQWEVHVLPAGTTFDPSAGTPYIASTNMNFEVTHTTQPTEDPLLPVTDYVFYVRPICEYTSGEWTVFVEGTTQPLPPVCGGSYVDNGGIDGVYLPSSNEVITICPDEANPTYQVTVTFTSFATESGWDGIYVYDGVGTSAPLIASENGAGWNIALSTPGAWWGFDIPGPFTSSSPDGCLTFQFISDTWGSFDGWVANVTCNPPPACPKPGALNVTGITTDSAVFGWTNIGPGTGWEVLALPCGSPAPTDATAGLPATSQTYTFEDLNSGYCYDLYVRANCDSSGNGMSAWAGPLDFYTNTLPPVCGGNLVDNGGVGGAYAANTDETVTICPTVPGDVVTVTFTQFDVETWFDGLYVYNGADTSAPQIPSANGPGFSTATEQAGAYWGNTIPEPFESTSADGCLTFVFKSDNWSTNYQGYLANITCATPPPCQKPLSVTVVETQSYGATLNWDPGTGTAWEVLALPCGSPAPDASVSGTPVTTLPPFTIGGLEADTCYDFYVRTDCSASAEGFSNWTFPKTDTTQVAPPVCGGQYIDLGGINGTYPPNSDSIVTICPETPGDIVIVTFVEFNTEVNYDGIYVYDGASTSSPMIASDNDAGFGAGVQTPGVWWGSELPGPFESSSPDGCLTFHFVSDGFVEYDGFVANVTCVPAPSCPKPTNVQVGVPTNNSVAVTWDPVGPATEWQLYAIPCGDPAPTGADTPNATASGTPSGTITGLDPTTCYQIYVISKCSDTEFSNPTMPKTITTQVDPPVCGGIFVDSGGPEGFYGTNEDSVVIVCPETPGDIVQVVFTYFDLETSYDGMYVYDGDSLSAPMIASNNDAGWNPDLSTPGAFWGNTPPAAFEASGPTGCLTFHFISNEWGQYGGWLANVNCYPAPTCPKPFGVNILETTPFTVTVDWTPNGPATQWEVLVLPVGSPAPDASSVGELTSSFPYTYGLTTPLLPGTQYVVYVRSVCAPGDTSSWTYPINFITPIVNDDCATALEIPVNSTPVCFETVAGSTAGASPSGLNPCFNQENDAWFMFTAVSDQHALSLQNLVSEDGFPQLNFALYEGTCDGGLTNLSCNFLGEGLLTGLVPGNVYYVQVQSAWSSTPVFFDVCITTLLPPISTAPMDTTEITPEYLIQEVLIGSDCAVASDISTLTGTDFNSTNGIGYFNKNGSSFQFEEGVILSTGDVNEAPGPNFNIQSNGDYLWPGDADLEAIILAATGNPMNSQNASIVEFNFVPITPQISFNFIFASEEYGTFQCSYSDAFAFLLTDVTAGGAPENLAVLPNSTTPVSVVTIRDQLYNTGCESVNPEYFDEYYLLPQGVGGLGAPINFNGVTVPLTAEATVVPGNTYHIKMVIADRSDTAYDSAVFLEGGSFDSGDVLFPDDLLQENLTALCAGDTYVLDTELDPADYTFHWYLGDQLLEGETGPTLTVTGPGTYYVDTDYLATSCGPEGSIIIEYYDPVAPVSDAELVTCDVSGFASFDLSLANSLVLGTTLPAEDYTLTYYLTEADAQAEVNPLQSPYTNVVANQQTIYVRVENAAGCFAVVPLQLIVNLNPPQVVLEDDVTNCGPYTLGIPTEGHYYLQAGGLGAIVDSTEITSSTTVYVYAGSPTCFTEDSFDVTILTLPTVDDFLDVAANCSYILPALTDGNTYWTGAGASGTQLFPGDSVSQTQEIWIYAGVAECFAETSFIVTVTPAPVLDPVQNIVSCVQVDLPALAVGNYFSDAAFTVPSPTSFTEVGVYPVYVYAETNGDPTCSASAMFTVEIVPSLVADDLADVQANCFYVLPTLSAGNAFWTLSGGPAGGGTQLQPGDVITMDQDIWVYATSVGCEPSETSFTVDITSPPAIDLPDELSSCTSIELPTLPAGAFYYSDAEHTMPLTSTTITSTTIVYAYAELIAPDGTACGTSDQVQVNIGVAPAVPTLNAITACEEVTLDPSLLVEYPGAAYYSQSGGVGPITTPITQSQEVFVYAADPNNTDCFNETSFSVTINQPVTVTINGECVGSAFVLTALDGSGNPFGSNAMYEWFDESGSFAGDTASITATATGSYTVTVSLVESSNCPGDAAPYEVTSISCTIQKGISANNDGMNDNFDLVGQNVGRLEIFNRYGLKVYSMNDYTNQWYGQSDKGEELPDGTYYYMIQYKDGKASQTGWIYINRKQ